MNGPYVRHGALTLAIFVSSATLLAQSEQTDLWIRNRFEFIVGPEFLQGYVVFIALWGSVHLLFFLTSALPIRSALARVTKELSAHQTKAKFKRYYRTYSDSLANEPFLKDAWNEFSDSLDHRDEEEIKNRREAGDYLNEDTILQPQIRSRYYQTVPSQLTGLGILGTFLGLMASIYLAREGLSSGITTQVTKSLTDLLRGASLAFSTSIAGIFFSLIFTFSERLTMAAVHRRLSEWVRALASVVEIATVESLAQEQLDIQKKQQEYDERTAAAVENFSDNLANRIEEALDQKVTHKLTDLIKAVKTIESEKSKQNHEAVGEIVESFTQNLDQHVGVQFEQIGKTLEQLNTTLSSSTQSMSELRDEVQGNMKTMLGAVTTALTTGSEQMRADLTTTMQHIKEGLNEAAASMSGTIKESGTSVASELRGSLSGFEQGVQVLQANTKETADMLQTFSQAHEDLRKTTEDLRKTTEPLVEVSGSLMIATTTLREQLSKSQELTESLNQAVTTIGESLETTKQSWEQYGLRFGDIDQELAKAWEKLMDGIGTLQKVNDDYVTRINHTIAGISKSLGSAIDGVQDPIEKLVELMEKSNYQVIQTVNRDTPTVDKDTPIVDKDTPTVARDIPHTTVREKR